MRNKIIITFAVVAFLLPQVTFAAWWSPSTWKVFNAAPQKKMEEKTVAPSNPQNSPLQKENSGSTEKKDVQKKTTSQAPAVEKIKKVSLPVKKIVAPIKKVSGKKVENSRSKPSATQAPTKTDKKDSVAKVPQFQPTPKAVSSVSNIKEKVSYVVQIVCPVNGGTSSGTGSIIYGVSNTDSKILTNKHVLNGATGPCGVYRTQNYESTPVLYFQSGTTFVFSTNYDLAILIPDVKTLNSYPNTNFQFNQSTDVFDRGIWVLGYPPSAGNNITLTKGVVSGSENMNGIVMYKTDAKIDNGNSGGAVFDEDGKFIGVPTLASQGNFSSYGYIIPAQAVKTFLDIVEQEGYGKQNWQHPQLSLYGVNPSNTVPEPAPRAQQNPAPQPRQEDPSLKIAKCQAAMNASRENFISVIKKTTNIQLQKIIDDPEVQEICQEYLTSSNAVSVCVENYISWRREGYRKTMDETIQKNESLLQQDYLKCLSN